MAYSGLELFMLMTSLPLTGIGHFINLAFVELCDFRVLGLYVIRKSHSRLPQNEQPGLS